MTVELNNHLMNTYGRLPVTLVRGRGMFVYDDQGREYLDFVAGVAVNALGHSHPAVVEAISEQSSRLVHVSNLYNTEPAQYLAEKLCELLEWPDGRVFFANSGAEANEAAIKLARKWSLTNFGPGRAKVVAALGSFHGRTLATLAATGQPAKWAPFAPMPQGFGHFEYDDLPALESAITPETAAVMLEPVQGERGVVAPSDDYFAGVRKICDSQQLVFIDDEVQTGIGRTGEWFGFQSCGAAPDVVTLAKALGNGMPVGACVARGALASTFEPGDHATTMGGGPVVCAAALAVLETVESEGLVKNAAAVGSYLKARLQALHSDSVVDVRGKGLLLGVQLSSEIAHGVVLAALEKGLLVNDVTPSVVRLCPPLVATKADCDRAVEALGGALSATTAKSK